MLMGAKKSPLLHATLNTNRELDVDEGWGDRSR